MDRMAEPAVLENQVFENETKCLWVFAYGSLCWKPGFSFSKAVPGCVSGYQRRFWQGNTTHRGTEEQPGRVATLVEDSEGQVYGVAFSVHGETALSYLSQRECEQGGYISKFTDFHPSDGAPFTVLLYVATPLNPLWLGDADTEEIAHQIINCRGPSGHNVEYLIRLANFMRNFFPDKHDPHLYNLEEKVLNLVEMRKLCLKTLMGSGEGCITFIRKSNSRESSPDDERRRDENRVETFEHTARVPGKKLRCLNI
ncbi:glutathione-specific gamma-glutamylcyclotransferase 1-like [Sitophilus oryzae]|uniref:glutathione-specific gamma-glutamylcyclotransferase n=1 Tax=Sitophilus oryzae TaxID=7048 RepID=A0A6J2XXA2_SITOR|nr:glutathione-specific gamma-glutamylcyclotransferase 1-like [Sitophilus oryzae]